jgi:5-methylcytosine-specific restriction endonuclease McrA
MSRAVPEWIAKHDDQAIPPRVKLRIFERENGICHLTGVKILPGDQWDADHKVPLILGGAHRENNLFPAIRADHRKKTATEQAVKSKVAKVRKKHVGITRPAGKIKSAPFPTTEKAESRSSKAMPPRRALYEAKP